MLALLLGAPLSLYGSSSILLSIYRNQADWENDNIRLVSHFTGSSIVTRCTTILLLTDRGPEFLGPVDERHIHDRGRGGKLEDTWPTRRKQGLAL
jgi:hypothetical protein